MTIVRIYLHPVSSFHSGGNKGIRPINVLSTYHSNAFLVTDLLESRILTYDVDPHINSSQNNSMVAN
ncbi:MAG: hypothetical protein PWR22_2275 [Moorella sp. (in: firmicutes)]|nr:hypothetical protein [Moorella sp. (in: firmicutes)]